MWRQEGSGKTIKRERERGREEEEEEDEEEEEEEEEERGRERESTLQEGSSKRGEGNESDKKIKNQS